MSGHRNHHSKQNKPFDNMKHNKQTVTIDENHVITYIKNALVSQSGMSTHNVTNGTVALPELTTNLVHTTFTLSNNDVTLTITSDYFQTFTFTVGKVRNNTLIISEYLCFIAGGRICKILKQLARRGESDPLDLFNIPRPNYDRVCDEQTTERKARNEVVSNTLF